MNETKTCICPVCSREVNPSAGLSGEEQIIKGIMELYKKMQEKQECRNCPRCGLERMAKRNALSRQFDIDVCPECGSDEALRAAGNNALPVSDWWIVREIYGFREHINKA